MGAGLSKGEAHVGQIHEDSHIRRLSSFPEETLALGSRQLGCPPRPRS